jgi:hypothetical protein
MYRTRQASWFRPFAALMAVWLPLLIGEPNLLSPCPAHGAYAAAQAAAGSAQHQGHESMAGQGGSDQSAPGHDEKDCACIGCCAPGVARTSVADVAIVTVATVAYEPTMSFATVETQPQPAPDLSRPYPTGPPQA